MDSLAQEPAGELSENTASPAEAVSAAEAADAGPGSAEETASRTGAIYTAASPEIRKLANAILAKAIKLEADSIFLEPGPEALIVGYRSEDGSLQLEPPLPAQVATPLLHKFKLLAGLNPEHRPTVQTRELKTRMRRRAFVFCLSFVPVQQGEVLGILVREIGKRGFGQPAVSENARNSGPGSAGNWGGIKQAFTRFSRSERPGRRG